MPPAAPGAAPAEEPPYAPPPMPGGGASGGVPKGEEAACEGGVWPEARPGPAGGGVPKPPAAPVAAGGFDQKAGLVGSAGAALGCAAAPPTRARPSRALAWFGSRVTASWYDEAASAERPAFSSARPRL